MSDSREAHPAPQRNAAPGDRPLVFASGATCMLALAGTVVTVGVVE